MTHNAGRHFLQLPGPSNVPERVLRAMHRPLVDHRGPGFGRMTRELLSRLGPVFGTGEPVVVYPASGTGGWEAALTNVLAPGDRVLAFDHGHFARKWVRVAGRLGLDTELRPGDWRRPVSPDEVREALASDPDHQVAGVLVVHHETSTGVVTDVAGVRAALDDAAHPALLLVDAVSSVGSMEYRHDDWRVDVTVSASQKGLMLPPGLAFNAVSPRARETSRRTRHPMSYWDWEEMLRMNDAGFFPYTPATSLLFGLREALDMLRDEGLENAFARHRRFAEAARAAVAAWGLDTVCADPDAHSPALTAVLTPEGHDADALRSVILERFDMSLGKGLGELEGRAFRIGHLGDFNDLMLAGTLAGVEMGLAVGGVPHRPGGVQEAMRFLAGAAAA